MQLNWHAISGPALTTATALAAFLVDRHFFPVPNPAPLFVCIVALAASVSGIASGMACAVIAVASSALFFLNHRATPGYDMSDLAPAQFGGTPGQGEWKILQDFLKNPNDVNGTASKLEAAAAKAFK